MPLHNRRNAKRQTRDGCAHEHRHEPRIDDGDVDGLHRCDALRWRQPRQSAHHERRKREEGARYQRASHNRRESECRERVVEGRHKGAVFLNCEVAIPTKTDWKSTSVPHICD